MTKLDTKTIEEVSLFLGRGQSPSYIEEESAILAINQKCVRGGKVDASYARNHNPVVPVRNESVLQEEDVCINSTGTGTAGRVGLWVGAGARTYFADSHVTVLRLRKDIADAAFITLLLQTHDFQVGLETYCFSGSTNQVELNRTALSKMSLSLPSLSEQKAIAGVFKRIDSVIEQTEAFIVKQKHIKTGLMQDLLTKGIDGNGDIRSEETHEFINSPVGRIPKDWEVIKVEQAGSVQLGRQRSPKHQSGRYSMPYLRVANVFDGWIDYSDILLMDFTPNERTTFGLLPGDILLNEGQSIELVGRSAIYEGYPNQYCFQNTLIRFRPFLNHDAGYCQSVFKFWLDKGRFMNVARQTTSVAHLGADRFAQMLFPRPELEEQKQIFQRLESQNEIINSEKLHLDKLKRIKAGLMQDLLSGELSIGGLLAADGLAGSGV